jgi:TP901 family phage tail tape measure protein
MPNDDELKARVSIDIPNSIQNIKDDLKKLSAELAADKSARVKIIGSLNILETQKLINAQLATISNGVKAPKIDLQVNTAGSSNSLGSVQTVINNTANSVNNLKSELMDLPAKFTQAIRPVTDTQGFVKVEETINSIKNAYKELGTISVNRLYDDDTSADSMKGFTIQIKSAVGEVRNLQYQLNNTGRLYEYIGGSASDSGVNRFVENVEKSMAKANVEATKLSTSLNKIQADINDTGVSRPIKDSSNIAQLETQYEKVKTAIEAVRNADATALPQMKANAEAEISALRSMESQFRNAENAATSLRTLDIDTIKAKNTNEIDKFANGLKAAGIESADLTQDINNLRIALNKIGATDKEGLTKFLNDFDVAKSKASALRSELTNVKKASNFSSDKSIFSNRIAVYMTQNTKAAKAYRVEFERIKEQLKTVDAAGLQRLKKEFTDLTLRAKAAGNNTKFLGERIKEAATKFTTWMSITTVITTGVRAIRDIAKNVIELDSAMVSLKKVTDATDSEFNDFLKSATTSAKELGASITDVVTATAEFSRLGYDLADSETLGKIATLYQNVGDGISAEEASQSIISAMKAFGYTAEQAIEIVDKFNEVGNKFSISSKGIGDALQRSASALAEANNDLSQSIALQVGANDVVQDPDTVGTMWKTVAMRIRGAKSELTEAGLETDGMVESTSQLRDIIKSMTGFDIMLDENTFKSTYDIVVGIGEQFDKLSDIDSASLLEKLAGKRQGNALSAALNNIEDIKAAYASAENSAGSAMAEQQEYMKGIQYSLDRLEATAEELSTTLINSDFLKGLVDAGTTVLSVLNGIISSLGTIPTLLTAIGTAMAFKNVGEHINTPPYASLHFVEIQRIA